MVVLYPKIFWPGLGCSQDLRDVSFCISFVEFTLKVSFELTSTQASFHNVNAFLYLTILLLAPYVWVLDSIVLLVFFRYVIYTNIMNLSKIPIIPFVSRFWKGALLDPTLLIPTSVYVIDHVTGSVTLSTPFTCNIPDTLNRRQRFMVTNFPLSFTVWV